MADKDKKQPNSPKGTEDDKKDPTNLSAEEIAEALAKAEQRRQTEEGKLLESQETVEKMEAMVAKSLSGDATSTKESERETVDITNTGNVAGFDTAGNVIEEAMDDDDNNDMDTKGVDGARGGASTAAQNPPQATGTIKKNNKAKVSSSNALRLDGNRGGNGKPKPTYGGYFAEIQGWAETPTGSNVRSLAQASNIDINDDRFDLIKGWVNRTLEVQRAHGFDISKDIVNKENVFDVKRYLEKYDTNPETDPNLRELKERAVYTILSGLLLFMARFDVQPAGLDVLLPRMLSGTHGGCV